jgi:DNA-binding CsgD family transcriptional regulator
MSRSHAETSRRALARLQRLCCLGIGGEMLMPDLIQDMMGLVPSQNRTFFWLGPNFDITNVCGTLPAPLKELYFKEIGGTRRDTEVWQPYRERVTTGGPNLVQRAAQILRVDQRTFLRSDYYNLLMRPVDAYEPLLLPIREADRILGMFFVWRAACEVPFDSRKLKMLEAAAGFVAHGLTRARMEDDAFADSEDRALFVADVDGTVQHAGKQAQRLLMMALVPRWSTRANWRSWHEPMAEIARLCRMLVATANGEIGQPPPVLRLRTPWGEFLLRAYWLGPTDGAEQTRQIGITIERRVPRMLALHRRVEDLPLTSREKQLCVLLARGPAGHDLADSMGLAASTVITHQRSIYAKLGVHSRAELLLALEPGRQATRNSG